MTEIITLRLQTRGDEYLNKLSQQLSEVIGKEGCVSCNVSQILEFPDVVSKN